MGLWSCDVLFQLVFIVQAAKDRTCHHTVMCRQAMPLLLKWSRQSHERLGNTRPQGHVRAPCIVMRDPLREDASQVAVRQGNQVIQAFPAQRANEPFTKESMEMLGETAKVR